MICDSYSHSARHCRLCHLVKKWASLMPSNKKRSAKGNGKAPAHKKAKTESFKDMARIDKKEVKEEIDEENTKKARPTIVTKTGFGSGIGSDLGILEGKDIEGIRDMLIDIAVIVMDKGKKARRLINGATDLAQIANCLPKWFEKHPPTSPAYVPTSPDKLALDMLATWTKKQMVDYCRQSNCEMISLSCKKGEWQEHIIANLTAI